MSGDVGVRESPAEFADRVVDQLQNLRAANFKELSGDNDSIKDLKSTISRLAPLPSLQAARQCVETAFYASIAREEGSDVIFSLLWTDPALAQESSWPRMQFQTSLALDVEAVRKLSPASDPDLVDIAAFEGAKGPEIWGLLFLRDRMPGRRSLPPGFAIVVDAPGALTVKMGGTLVGTYSRGYGVVVQEGIQIDKIGLVQLLAKIFSDGRDGREKLMLASKIVNFASEALEAKQGATLLVTMGRDAPVGVQFSKYGIEDVSRNQLSDRLADNEFLYLSRSMSRVALVDGAVVMNEHGTIYGFGGMIQTDAPSEFNLTIVDSRNFKGAGKDLKLSEFSGGSRHRSALSFCYANTGSVALVVSHDGVMSVMTRPIEEDRVIVIRPFLKTFDLGL